ncbi:MAG: hypothetical protein LBJ18_01580 [Rickettsiales bacterium]|jgi:hypothetical protein|nr:hypothetical protein [Rickettsiales bacterium]
MPMKIKTLFYAISLLILAHPAYASIYDYDMYPQNGYVDNVDWPGYDYYFIKLSNNCVAVYSSSLGSQQGCLECGGSCGGLCGTSDYFDFPSRTRLRDSNYNHMYCSDKSQYDSNAGAWCEVGAYMSDEDYVIKDSSNNTFRRVTIRVYENCQPVYTNLDSYDYCSVGRYLSGGVCLVCVNGAASGVVSYHRLDEASACKPAGCAANHYGNGTTCTACPCMTDTGGISRCGTSSAGTILLDGCVLPTGYTFPETTGNFQFTNPCPAS